MDANSHFSRFSCTGPRLLQGAAVAKSRPESGNFRGLRARLRGCCKVQPSPKAVPRVVLFAACAHGFEAAARFSRRQKPSIAGGVGRTAKRLVRARLNGRLPRPARTRVPVSYPGGVIIPR